MDLTIRLISPLFFNISRGEKTLDKYVSPIFQERPENMEKLGCEYAKEV